MTSHSAKKGPSSGKVSKTQGTNTSTIPVVSIKKVMRFYGLGSAQPIFQRSRGMGRKEMPSENNPVKKEGTKKLITGGYAIPIESIKKQIRIYGLDKK